MSDAAAAPETQDGPAATRAPGKGLLAGAAFGALMAGAAVGFFAVAPRIAPTPALAATAATAEAAHAGGEAHGGGHGGEAEGEVPKIVRVENLVVNPAGTQGSRFLMTSVAFEVGDSAERVLVAREVELRDRVIAVLEAQTIAELTQADARTRLKEKLSSAVAPMVGPRAKVAVFLPQFVIQ